MLHRELLIAGTFIGGPCDYGTGKEVVRAPWDAAVIGSYAEAGWAEADAALHAATEAFPAWRATAHKQRTALCGRIAHAIRDRSEELASLVAHEVGKPITWARAEVERSAITFDLSSRIEQRSESHDLEYDPRGRDYRAEIRRFPIGVVLAIAPYNWPLNLAAHKIGPALATGNTVVLKGAPQSGLTSLTLARIIHEAGCPAGVFQAIQCANQVAQRMVEDERIAMMSFTGSAAVGWMLKERVPKKSVCLELGGNAAAIVSGDAPLEDTVDRLVRSAYGFAGQVCISAQNVFVHESRLAEFWEAFAAATRQVRVGDPQAESTLCGPVIDSAAAIRIAEWVESSGTKRSGPLEAVGNRVEPIAVLLDDFAAARAARDKLATQEVFGPVATVSPYREIEEVVGWINSGLYGIHTSYFGTDAAQIQMLLEELDVSGLIVNDAPTVRFDGMPYGGQRLSGFGREGVPYAAEEFTTPRVVVERRL